MTHVPGIAGFGGQMMNAPLSFAGLGARGLLTSPTVTLTGHKADDLCVFFDWTANNTGPPATAIPAGFSSVINTVGVQRSRAIISVKKLTGAETTLTGMLIPSGWSQKVALLFRVYPGWPGAWGLGLVGTCVDTDPVAQTIAIGAEVRRPQLMFGQMGCWGGSGAVGRVFAPMVEIPGGDASHFVHFGILNPGWAQGNVTYDMADSGNDNTLQSGYLNFTGPTVQQEG
jgi:hypothetical protein